MIRAIDKSPRAVPLGGTIPPRASAAASAPAAPAAPYPVRPVMPPRPHTSRPRIFECWSCLTPEHSPSVELPEGWKDVGEAQAVCPDCAKSIGAWS